MRCGRDGARPSWGVGVKAKVGNRTNRFALLFPPAPSLSPRLRCGVKRGEQFQLTLEIGLAGGSVEGDDVSDVFHAGEVHDEAFEA